MSGYAQYKNRVKISERHGAREWVVERVSLLLLMPLGVWAASSAFTLAGADYDTAAAWFASTLNAVLLGVTAVVLLGYISLAWKVIIEDYIHRPGNKALLIGLSNLIFLVLAAVSVFFITRLALGSAPLPAGFGA
ncbi:succinate dehydrogenase, hydrophobic membrane anchor protein [Brevundimonas sp.]|uniref:succinate dehydrogenase, hydrophobic membrane anchor protein n=1 Tax=Brevundimonas sp. TaxID=1871086 RepID=UPI00391C47EE